MKRLRCAVCAVAVAVAVACGPEIKEAPLAHPPSQSLVMAQKLALHRQLQGELAAAEEELLAASASYGRAKGKYVTALLTELGVEKAPTGAIRSITEMADERDRISAELQSTLRSVGAALAARAAAEEKFLSVEVALWDLEAAAYGGRRQAAARAEEEIKLIHDDETSLHVAQKSQQNAYSTLLEREFIATATVDEEVRARDRFDRQLTELRDDLAAQMTRLINAARMFDDASDKIHRKLLAGINPREKLLIARGRTLLVERGQAAQAIARARLALEPAILKRAEQRLREIDHDAEIAAVVDGLKPSVRDAVLHRSRSARDAAAELRIAARDREQAYGEARKKLVTLEAAITSLGY